MGDDPHALMRFADRVGSRSVLRSTGLAVVAMSGPGRPGGVIVVDQDRVIDFGWLCRALRLRRRYRCPAVDTVALPVTQLKNGVDKK